jgi:hypothetical protein
LKARRKPHFVKGKPRCFCGAVDQWHVGWSCESLGRIFLWIFEWRMCNYFSTRNNSRPLYLKDCRMLGRTST